MGSVSLSRDRHGGGIQVRDHLFSQTGKWNPILAEIHTERCLKSSSHRLLINPNTENISVGYFLVRVAR